MSLTAYQIAIHFDFETRSAVDLKNASTHAYAVDPSTDVWCMAYAIGEGQVQLWKQGEPFPSILMDILGPEFYERNKDDFYFVAHNAAFELTIWNNLCVKKYGWPPLPIERTYCTMAMAYAQALPASLENAAVAVNLDVKKDMDGRRLMVQMASPRRRNDDGTFAWWDQPERLERLYAYCVNDVIVERELEKKLLHLSPAERAVWLLDQKINDRGVRMDIPNIVKAMSTIDSEKERLNALMSSTTWGAVNGVGNVSSLMAFAEDYGVYSNGLAKGDIAKLLAKGNLPEQVKQALEIRKEGAKASTAKLKAMLLGVSPDWRVRGMMQYHAATTGRWGGRKVQPQNFPRPDMSVDEILDALNYLDDPDMLRALYGSPMNVISNCLRAMLIAEEGKEFIACDFSSIEARGLAWLAGEESILDLFRRNEGVYEAAAADIFNIAVEQVSKLQRLIGKVAVLALGFGGGAGAFQSMAKIYNVDMAQALPPLAARASIEQRKQAESMWAQYSKRKQPAGVDPMEYDTYIASELTKQFWRAANPNIVRYWKELETAAMSAIRNKGTAYVVAPPGFPHRGVRYLVRGSFLWCRLPSGRSLCYPFPSIQLKMPPWESEDADASKAKPSICFMGVNPVTRSWGEQKTYSGALAENITQAVARDFLVEAMFNCEKNGYPVVFHVHDEIVCELAKGLGSVEEMEEIMSQLPSWGFDCPIAAEGWASKRYRK